MNDFVRKPHCNSLVSYSLKKRYPN